MNTKWKSLTGALALGIGVAGCDVPPDEATNKTNPNGAVALDEGDSIPNVVARLDVGTSTVYFAEPAPGVIIVGEKAGQAPVLNQGMPSDPGALWASLAPDRAVPAGLQHALARFRQAELKNKGAIHQQPAGTLAVIGETDADQPLNLGPDVLAVSRGAVQDPSEFISYYCSAYSARASISEACWTNRTTSSNDLNTFEISGDVHFARAGVAVYRGSLRFVPEWRSFFSWSTLADQWTSAGQAISWRISRSQPSFGFRFRLLDAAGDGFHHIRWVDGSAIDGWGAGFHVIPNNR
jgi:hypothetical protein